MFAVCVCVCGKGGNLQITDKVFLRLLPNTCTHPPTQSVLTKGHLFSVTPRARFPLTPGWWLRADKKECCKQTILACLSPHEAAPCTRMGPHTSLFGLHLATSPVLKTYYCQLKKTKTTDNCVRLHLPKPRVLVTCVPHTFLAHKSRTKATIWFLAVTCLFICL